jgi:sucrose-6-phosphate hydrolase SacC (GH32 family)
MLWENPLVKVDLSFDISSFGSNASIAICFVNSFSQEICTGWDNGKETNIFVNREKSGNLAFSDRFYPRPTAVRENQDNKAIAFEIYLDVSAVEVFVDGGLTCLTTLFYPDEPFTKIEIRHHSNGITDSTLIVTSAKVQGLNPSVK